MSFKLGLLMLLLSGFCATLWADSSAIPTDWALSMRSIRTELLEGSASEALLSQIDELERSPRVGFNDFRMSAAPGVPRSLLPAGQAMISCQELKKRTDQAWEVLQRIRFTMKAILRENRQAKLEILATRLSQDRMLFGELLRAQDYEVDRELSWTWMIAFPSEYQRVPPQNWIFELSDITTPQGLWQAGVSAQPFQITQAPTLQESRLGWRDGQEVLYLEAVARNQYSPLEACSERVIFQAKGTLIRRATSGERAYPELRTDLLLIGKQELVSSRKIIDHNPKRFH